MNIQQLEYIIAVDNYKSFSKAAEASFVTQPTLSMMIQKLEDELDVKIFDRKKVPVETTKIGEAIINQSRIIVSNFNKIKNIVKEEKGIIKGSLRIGIIPTVSQYLLPKVMQIHSQTNRDIKIIIKEMNTSQIIKGLSNDSIDAGILATPLRQENIIEYPLYYEKFVAYVSPLEKEIYSKIAITESDLLSTKLWLLEDIHCFRIQIEKFCKKNKKQNNSIFSYEAGSINTLINIVDNNKGITIIPEMAIEGLNNTQKRNIRYFNNTTPIREISIITREDFVRKKFICIISDEIKSSVPLYIKSENTKGEIISI